MTPEKLLVPSENFVIQEFVPKTIFEIYGDTSIRFLNPQLFTIAKGIREYFGKPMRINDWHRGGSLHFRGFRPHDCNVGSKYSAHKRGMALDFDIAGVDDASIQRIIEEEYETYFKHLGITAIEEDTDGWTHVSCENFNMEELKKIPFYKKK